MKPISPLHAAARRYASQGFPVFPCCADDPSIADPVLRNKVAKRPWTEHGFHDATTDLAQIDAWWGANPDLNIAFSPHTVGLAVIDPDGEEGLRNWEAWQIEHGYLPPTYTVRTPRGGLHLYFHGILPPSQSKLAPHVDTRGVGSYALLPPSRVCGNEYVVEDERTPAELPEHVGAFLQSLQKEHVKAAVADLDQPQNVARAEKLLRDYAARGHVAVEGQMGDYRTFVTACEVLNLGLSEDRAADLLADLWNPHCVPPWDEDELRVKVENAARYSQNEAGAWATETSDQAFGSALDKLAPELLAPSPEPNKSPFKRLTLTELRNRPPPNWLIPEAVPEKSLAALYGPPSSLKSFLAMDWGLTLACLGQPVIYVAGEGSSDLGQRAEAWCLAHGVEGELPFEVIETAPWASDDAQLDAFCKEAAGMRPVLVIIDTLARSAVGLNENDAKDMGRFVWAMDYIKRGLQCTVLVIHHTGKDEGRGTRGSNAFEAAIDAGITVKRNKELGLLEVRVARQKFAAERAEPWCYEVRNVGPSAVLNEITVAEYRARIEPSRIGPKDIGRLLRQLNATPDNPMSTHVLAFELVHAANPDLSDEEAKPLVDREARILGKRGREAPLNAYCIEGGHGLEWSLPDGTV